MVTHARTGARRLGRGAQWARPAQSSVLHSERGVLAVAHIIDVDNEASNGVVHVVDSVF